MADGSKSQQDSSTDDSSVSSEFGKESAQADEFLEAIANFNAIVAANPEIAAMEQERWDEIINSCDCAKLDSELD